MLPKVKKPKELIYLDHAATTYLDPQVKRVMEPFWLEKYGNPSSLYTQGREASSAILEARKTVSCLIGAKPGEIIFTAGGTESINLAIFGVAKNFQPTKDNPFHLLTSAIEHHAVLHCYEALQEQGFKAQTIEVDEEGFVKLDQLKAAVRPETILISIMTANNEIGTIQPIAEIGKWLRVENEKRKARNLPTIIFHTDACQAAGVLDLNVQKLGVDLLTVNGSKIYGSKQTGFLYIRTGIKLKPIIYGGGQEQNLRSGTENVAGVVGLAKAFELAQKNREKENKRIGGLRDYFLKRILKEIPKVVLNGPDTLVDKIDGRPKSLPVSRLPNNLNISILDIEGEALLLYLDSYGIAASTGSACTSQSLDPSHVLIAIGRPYEYAHGSLRFTLGKKTDKQQVDYVMKVLPGIVETLRRVSPLNLKVK